MTSEEISGEEVLECGKLCVKSFAKLLPVFISKLKDEFFQTKTPGLINF